MISIVIIGSGNVAQHLITAFANNDTVTIIQVFARNKKSLTSLVDYSKITSDYTEIKEADLYIISVSDDAITEVSSQIPFTNKLVAHTSGSVGLDELDLNHKKAVFYPLQTFSKNKAVNFKEIPICIEAQNHEDLQILKKVAKSISDKVFEINSQQRKALHVAAVFVSNFVNYMYQVGNEICNENNIPFELLQPLMQETVNKVMEILPREAQTGPAVRNDTTTIQKHLDFLKDEKNIEIYKLITKSILENGKKL